MDMFLESRERQLRRVTSSGSFAHEYREFLKTVSSDLKVTIIFFTPLPVEYIAVAIPTAIIMIRVFNLSVEPSSVAGMNLPLQRDWH